MSSEAHIIQVDGKRILKQAKELVEADRDTKFRCCGCNFENPEELCNAKMVPCIGEKKKYFRNVDGATIEDHVINCTELEKAVLMLLDEKGAGYKDEELFEKINHPPVERETVGTELTIIEEEKSEDDKKLTTSIEVRMKNPNSIRQLYLLLRGKEIEDVYAGKKVCERLIDERCIKNVLANPNEEDRIDGYRLVVVTNEHIRYDRKNFRIFFHGYTGERLRSDGLKFILQFEDEATTMEVYDEYCGARKSEKGRRLSPLVKKIALFAQWKYISPRTGKTDFQKIAEHSYIATNATPYILYEIKTE